MAQLGEAVLQEVLGRDGQRAREQLDGALAWVLVAARELSEMSVCEPAPSAVVAAGFGRQCPAELGAALRCGARPLRWSSDAAALRQRA